MTAAEFTRRLRNLEGMQRREAALTRNFEASARTMRMRCAQLRDALAVDARTDDAPLCAFLDAHPGIAARWSRAERRSAGLAP